MTVQTLERKLKPFEEPVKGALLKWLYLHLPPQPITSRKMHGAYAEAAGILLKELGSEALAVSQRKAIERYLRSAVPFVEDYEKKEFPIRNVTPEAVLKFLMEQHGLSQYDLAGDLGGQSVVSDVLRGKRKLTRDHIERLSRRFRISPATFYPPGI
jgi:antitoxin component HigA of HigAB toxin-antitoxin module